MKYINIILALILLCTVFLINKENIGTWIAVLFAAVCLDENDEPYYITLKLEPSEGDFLRKQYEDIIPGYYMNKIHWNSIKPDGEVPDDLLKDLLDKSYRLVLSGFSKKKQREILE